MATLNDYYSPHTGERIENADPAPWMSRAGVDCPAYNAATQGAFWRGGPEWMIENVVPVVSVPQSVTPAQGLMALYALKRITEDDILAAINTIEDATLRYQAKIAYKKATIWERVSVSWQAIAGLMALSEADQDELLTKAATYTNL